MSRKMPSGIAVDEKTAQLHVAAAEVLEVSLVDLQGHD